MRYFMGIDLGTSSVKVVVLSEEGVLAAQSAREMRMESKCSTWAEQEPEMWWEKTKEAAAEAIAGLGKERAASVGAIGLTGQMLGSVFLDRRGKAVRSCMLWCDQRSHAERDAFEQRFGLDYILEATGNYPLTGYWAPKLLWLQKHEPQNYERVDKLLFPKDYIRFRLTGEKATDVSDAGGSGLFDVENFAWHWPLIDACGFDRAWFVKAYRSEEIAGYLEKDVADALGLRGGIPVAAGGGDQPVCGVGLGIVEEGAASVSLGTSGVVFACTDRLNIDCEERALHSFCHAASGKWCVYGCTMAAGSSMRWLRDRFFQEERDLARRAGVSSYDMMTLMARQAKPGASGLLYLPYLIGERTPYPDPYARGVFVGFTLLHGKPEMVRSVMEGITFSLKDSLRILEEFGVGLRQVRVAGGGARSELWRQMQADIYGMEILTTNVEEGPATGAAILAAVAAGGFKDIPEACARVVRVTSSLRPDKERAKRYEELYEIYRSLYPALKPAFYAIGKTMEKGDDV